MTPEQHNDPIQDARRMLEKDEFGLYIHRPDYAQVRANILMHQALQESAEQRSRTAKEKRLAKLVDGLFIAAHLTLFAIVAAATCLIALKVLHS